MSFSESGLTAGDVHNYDQARAEAEQYLEEYVAAHKVDCTAHGETVATMGLAAILANHAGVDTEDEDANYFVPNLLTVAIHRLANK